MDVRRDSVSQIAPYSSRVNAWCWTQISSFVGLLKAYELGGDL